MDDDFNYFDFISFDGESCLFPLLGLVLSPVLFPIYLVLKIITVLIELLSEALSYMVEGIKNSIKNNGKDDLAMEVASVSKKEAIESKLKELKAKKAKVEKQIEKQNQVPVIYTKEENTIENEVIERPNNGPTLRLRQ